MDSQNRIQKSYEQRAKVYSERMQWVDDQQFITPFIAEAKGEKRALDACAGTGAVSKMLLKNGWNVVSLDISDEMMKTGKLTNKVIGSVENIPFDDNSFELITCRQGLQYTDLEASLSEIMRVAKDKVVLGHITKEINDNYDFWNEYFKIASPGRKIILKPYQIAEEAEKLGFIVSNIEVRRQMDFYNGPLLHLPKAEYDQLVEFVMNQSETFKKLYHIVENNGDIVYSNRWEFVTLYKSL